ncbi:hypothetical protein, partial [Alloalcanivorax xenomutans]
TPAQKKQCRPLDQNLGPPETKKAAQLSSLSWILVARGGLERAGRLRRPQPRKSSVGPWIRTLARLKQKRLLN